MVMKKQLSRRDFIKITGMAAAAGLLASCQPKATEVPMETDAPDVSPPEPEAIEIVHWVEHYLLPDLEDFKAYQDAAMEAYHEKYPNVTVIAEDHGWDEALRQNLVTALLGGTAPDVIVGENFFQQYVI